MNVSFVVVFSRHTLQQTDKWNISTSPQCLRHALSSVQARTPDSSPPPSSPSPDHEPPALFLVLACCSDAGSEGEEQIQEEDEAHEVAAVSSLLSVQKSLH